MRTMADPKVKERHPVYDAIPNYPHHEDPKLPDHFSMLSAPDHTYDQLKEQLSSHGYTPTQTIGHYTELEKSFLVPHKGTDSDHRTIEKLAWGHNQEAVLHSSLGSHKLTFQDQSISPWEGKGHVHGPFLNKFFTELPSGHRISLNVKNPLTKSSVFPGFNQKPGFFQQRKAENYADVSKRAAPHYYGQYGDIHVYHSRHKDHEQMMGAHHHDIDDNGFHEAMDDAQAKGFNSIILHGNIPSMLRDKAPGSTHPHNYDWHDGHTDHYEDEDLGKKIEYQPHPGNKQAAGAGVKTYGDIAKRFGSIKPGTKTNLKFYPNIHQSEAAIDKMIKDNGYETTIAGGKYGKPDLKNKNYNTGHIMIWDPTPQSGGDFGDEDHTQSWRKVHELSHALTYKEVNGLYGEGRRIGKVGTRTPHEAKRAVHWEWMAAHKQRDISMQLGHKISNEDFNKEVNTIMHDAVHRANHGKFTEPADEGFQPSSEKIDLEQSLKMVDDHAKSLGLNHPNATLAGTSVKKSELIEELEKAFLQEDGESVTDSKAHSQAIGPIPKGLIEWGRNHLVSMDHIIDGPKVLELDGKIIKVRKVLEDLYSGWIEKEGNKIHGFEKLSLPELLTQIQSKLELYGREDEVMVDDEKLEAEKVAAGSVTAEEAMEEAMEAESKADSVRDKLNELKETISRKELSDGMISPEKECPACERKVEDCVCYTGLPKPRVEFDGKKVTIFFKSQWNEMDRENFVSDLKKRAGDVLVKRRANAARNVLADIRKKLKDG